MARRQKTPADAADADRTPPTTAPADLRERILADFAALKVPLTAEQLDAVLADAQRDGLSHLEFLHRLLAEQADQRRERSIAHRIREARFRERKPLSAFDWEFNRAGHRPRADRGTGHRRLHPPPGQPRLRRAKRRGQSRS